MDWEMPTILTIVLILIIALLAHTITKEDEDSWAYQLQNAKIDEILKSGFRIFVMDYSTDGTQDGAYSPEDIQRLKDAGITPLAYLSIGEAEDYRWYWNDTWYTSSPQWLGEENPEWEGNYAVKYWYPEWRSIVLTYLDIIISQGFSGVYLDKVDEYEYWMERGVENAPHLMASLIMEIRNHTPENFLIVPQNGEGLMDYEPQILDVVSGWAAEDVFYNGTIKNPAQEVEWRTERLDMVISEGKFVLSVDYVDDGSGFQGENRERILDYIHEARSKGYIPYAALSDRSLSTTNVIEGVQPPG